MWLYSYILVLPEDQYKPQQIALGTLNLGENAPAAYMDGILLEWQYQDPY